MKDALHDTLFGRSPWRWCLRFSSPRASFARTPAHFIENLPRRNGSRPPMLPPGAQSTSSRETRPSRTLYRRLKFPATSHSGPSHPGDYTSWSSGELSWMGQNWTRSRAGPPRRRILADAGPRHSLAFTRSETIIVLYGQGPVDFNYVDPADDPRTKTSTRASR